MKFRIDDEVQVIAGADKGRKGKILKIDRVKNKVVVEGIARVWKHVRRSQKNPQGGRLNKEMPISASNVMLVDPTTGKQPKSAFATSRMVVKSGTPRLAVRAWERSHQHVPHTPPRNNRLKSRQKLRNQTYVRFQTKTPSPL